MRNLRGLIGAAAILMAIAVHLPPGRTISRG